MAAEKQKWQILDLLNSTTDYLTEKGIEDARLNTERLLGHSLNLSRVDLYLNYDRPLTSSELSQFKGYLKRRIRNEPLQYIIGETEFMSLTFKVNPSVLIPRPETEILVEKAIEICGKKFDRRNIKILDIGAGSGCIAVSLAKYLEGAEITALDVSKPALEVAEQNAHLNKRSEKICFLEFDFLDQTFTSSEKFDVVVSNPPYISSADFENLPEEIKAHEPSIALKDGPDGLRFFRRIAEACGTLLHKDGFVMVEVGLGQADAVKDIFSANGYTKIEALQDLNNIERIVFCEF